MIWYIQSLTTLPHKELAMHKIAYHLSSVLACFCIIFTSCSKSTASQKTPPPEIIHTSQLSPGWYNQDAAQLSKELDSYLKLAEQNFAFPLSGSSIKALIAPHAGYYYSGLCAATAYQTLLDPDRILPLDARKNKTIKRVIILAPSHTTFYNGIALPDYTVYRTALGDIPVDRLALSKLEKSPFFKKYQLAHDKEHAVEMQLPLLQKTVDDFSIVPLVVGHMTPENIYMARLELAKIIDDTTLVVVSSDFVHHGREYDYMMFDNQIIKHVRVVDSYATQALSMQSSKAFQDILAQTHATICGQEPLKILLGLLEMNALQKVEAHITDYYTSANMAQARNNNKMDIAKLSADVADQAAQTSVSYVGMVFTTPSDKPSVLTSYEKQSLLTLARNAIANAFKDEQTKLPEYLMLPITSIALMQPAGAFVTLQTKDGQLRGCIGRITTPDALCKTVYDMSLAAAFNDTRFSPVTQDELENLTIEISILTPPVKIAGPDDIVIGRHGVILNKLNNQGQVIASSVFLPQVARDLRWDVQTTLEQLSLKAGLGKDAWKEGCSFEVFESVMIRE